MTGETGEIVPGQVEPFDYVICVRKVKDGRFIAEPGPTRYLKVTAEAPSFEDLWLDDHPSEVRYI